jgi:hypothetical protein
LPKSLSKKYTEPDANDSNLKQYDAAQCFNSTAVLNAARLRRQERYDRNLVNMFNINYAN